MNVCFFFCDSDRKTDLSAEVCAAEHMGTDVQKGVFYSF